jgi:hypothetical protein
MAETYPGRRVLREEIGEDFLFPQAMRSRVRHFGHSTQWRMRDIRDTPMEISGTPIDTSSLVREMVGSNTHLTGFGHDHYDPGK